MRFQYSKLSPRFPNRQSYTKSAFVILSLATNYNPASIGITFVSAVRPSLVDNIFVDGLFCSGNRGKFLAKFQS